MIVYIADVLLDEPDDLCYIQHLPYSQVRAGISLRARVYNYHRLVRFDPFAFFNTFAKLVEIAKTSKILSAQPKAFDKLVWPYHHMI